MGQSIEEKWQKRWAEARLFEAEPQPGRKKFYLTAAYPYPNSPQHIGHARTYTTTDVYARFKRAQGYNVLFPMGFHVTGTPILAMAKRLAAREEELLSLFEKVFGIPKEISLSLAEPTALVAFFSREIEQGMREMGFSIDWRRKFYTYDPDYNAFIQWQFRKLKERGFITKGAHPVPWCPRDNQAVGSHDTRGDIDPELGEFTLIKFAFGDAFLPAATLRPETIYGVTSMWINSDADYVRARVDDENWIVSKEGAEKLAAQGRKVEVLAQLKGSDVKGECINPINSQPVPIFPASFVDPSNATGVVMSVPAHAPYDYLALRDYLRTAGQLSRLEAMLVPVLKIEGYGSAPAKEISEAMGIASQNDPKAEEATREIYRKEAHTGVMVAGKYAGERVLTAKEKIKADLLGEGKASLLHEIINGPVYCRCGARCIVKSIKDQWFIDYGNAAWKRAALECLQGMRVIPQKTIPEYEYTIGWLKEKACTRAQGLGTRFPFDERQMIEALSDSTIYMAYYTVVHILRREEIPLSEAAFDYIFLGRGKGSPALDAARREFLYWYPLDSRHSATDLVHNHLTFFIFNHTAVFPRELWPRQIVTNGFVLMEGSKMSKSLGNILPLRLAIRKYGADVVRFSVVSGADLAQDADFNETLAEAISTRLKYFASLAEIAATASSRELNHLDRWMLSRLHRKIRDYEKNMEELRFREVAQDVFYNLANELRWYARRTGKANGRVLREVLENWILLIAPFMPHFAEEAWERLGKKQFVKEAAFVSAASLPEPDETKISPLDELGEEIVISTRGDIENIQKITGKKAKRIFLYVAADWKRALYRLLFEEKKFEPAIKRAMADAVLRQHAKDASRVLAALAKNIGGLSPVCPSQAEEEAVLREAIPFLSGEFGGAEVAVAREEDAPAPHAAKAEGTMPLKPSIFIE
ncbi:MAG: leucine--tRNA ligase [Candidatus Micrarchaeia archaeon]